MCVEAGRTEEGESMRNVLARIAAMTVSAGGVLPGSAHAQVYNWVTWNFPTAQSAAAAVPGLGMLGVSVQGADTMMQSWNVQFDSVPFTPTTVQSAAAHNQTAALSNWSTTIDLMGLTDSAGLILGIGNFGFVQPNYPEYRLTARDRQGNAMPLTGFQMLGSYDHTWLTGPAVSFNDDVVLNPMTGLFSGTTVPGLNNGNTDILLFACPTDVGSLLVETSAPQMGGDTLNIVAAVPAPGAMILLLGGYPMSRRRRW
jgi:hypothetical protein